MALLATRRNGSTPATTTRPSFTRWDPFAEFEDLYERMGRLFQSALGELGRLMEDMPWSPMADLSETDDSFVVEVDLPGVKKDDVTVEMHDRELVITGEVKPSDRDGRWHWRTRRMGRFEHRVLLPGEVNSDKISATLTDGVLTITVPKAEAAKPRRVEITGG